jgi:hypothetical protein
VQHKLAAPPPFTLDKEPGWQDGSAKLPAAQELKTWYENFGTDNQVAAEIDTHWTSLQAKVKSSESSLATILAQAKATHTKIEGSAQTDFVVLRGLIGDVIAQMKALQSVGEDLQLAKDFLGLAASMQTKFSAELDAKHEQEEKAKLEAEYKVNADNVKTVTRLLVSSASAYFLGDKAVEKYATGATAIVNLLIDQAVNHYYSEKAKDQLLQLEVQLNGLAAKIDLANREVVDKMKSMSETFKAKATRVDRDANAAIKEKSELIRTAIHSFATRKGQGNDVLQKIFATVEQCKTETAPDAAYLLPNTKEAAAELDRVDGGASLAAQAQAAVRAIATELQDDIGGDLVPPDQRIAVSAIDGKLIVNITVHGSLARSNDDTRAELQAKHPETYAKIVQADKGLTLHPKAVAYGKAFEAWKNGELAELHHMQDYVATNQHLVIAQKAITAANELAGMSQLDWNSIKAAL